ncbi:DUF5011 domain-containing protein [Hymenobacter nivis]|uniref:DUF5011 domain-containing protein n=2 Tax=Hymenobacter nivis TaxID=1850093 RepID=A0A502H027_9BACT|nr:DUF5011 domain-containing protein [Hymenobacter nivis]
MKAMRKLALSLFGLAAAASSLAFSGCKKDETDNISRVKDYAGITLAGNEYYVINVGETFTEPGVTANLGGQPLTPTINNPVNSAKPGIYVIQYKGANTEGDTIARSRTVIVTDPAVNNLDQSGTFARSGFDASPVTKVGTKGLYKLDNFGFSTSPNLFPAYFVQIDATHIVVPGQTIPGLGYTTFTSVAGTFTAGKLTSIAYAIRAPAIFGSTVRAAVRQ